MIRRAHNHPRRRACGAARGDQARGGGGVSDCEHLEFYAHVGVNRLIKSDDGPVTGYVAEITVKCTACGLPFQFLGLKPGYDTQGATVSLDGMTANLALCPQGASLSPMDRLSYSIGAHRMADR